MTRSPIRYLTRTIVVISFLSALPIALGVLTEVQPPLMLIPLVLLGGLLATSIWLYRAGALSAGVAFALVAAAQVVVHVDAGFAALELAKNQAPANELPWFTQLACTDKAGGWILLCPFALMIDFLMLIVHVLQYVSRTLIALLLYVGPPVLFCAAAAWFVACVVALVRSRAEAQSN